MSDAPISPGRPNRYVECPECGEHFAPRGLAAHRRMRHGITPEAAIELAETLTRIASVLERLDARLGENATPAEAVEEAQSAPLPARPMSAAGRLLEEGVRDVLAEIARVKQETELQIRHVAGGPLTDEQKRLEQTAFQALSELRRRQAELIYRLQTQTGSNGNGFDALASL